ncbi:MAG: Na(+)-translocating NADH-quinone reductase subunit C [Gammaproteobacteria bacterium]|nr:Na(+)-translocating NADH-quinone reductase subunit C [Gammaproteobacteria bacterium]
MIRRLLALPNDDSRKIVFVAVSLCLVCSLLVSATAVLLQPLQEIEAGKNLRRNVLLAAGLMSEDDDDSRIDELFGRLEPRVVDLRSGAFTDAVNPENFNARTAARDPELGEAIADDADIANIRRRARFAVVHLVRDGDRIERIVLPAHGYGLWSTMYAFIALDADLNTVAAINFYEHGETPGLGGEIENPRWRSLWQGKLIFDEAGDVRLEVIKGNVDPANVAAAWQVDGISGSTLTGNGVTNMVRYWFGPDGFGPFLDRLRSEGV